MADDKTAAERAAEEFYTHEEWLDRAQRAAFVAGAAWQAEQTAEAFWSAPVTVAPDREALARVIERGKVEAEIRVYVEVEVPSLTDYSIADALLASGLFVPADQVRAEAMEEAEEIARTAFSDPGYHPYLRQGANTVAELTASRAAEYRKAAGA